MPATPTTHQRPRPETKRTFRVLRPVTPQRPGRVRIITAKGVRVVRTEETDYELGVFAGYDGGLGVSVHNCKSGEDYTVLLCHRDYHCTCKGYLAHGHCKHFDVARTMLTRGLLPKPE